MQNNSLILIFSVVALFSAVFARIKINSAYSLPLYIISFLAVAFCVTYAFLLGIAIYDILTYILVYTLLNSTVFWHNLADNSELPIKCGTAK